MKTFRVTTNWTTGGREVEPTTIEVEAESAESAKVAALLGMDQLTAVSQEVQELMPDDVMYVNVYLVDLAYGGPEEGGWWYQHEEPVEILTTTRAESEALKKKLEAEYNNEGRPSISSTLSEGRYDVRIEYTAGQDSPAVRPQYC